ncbi:hypothetical protein MASR2M41_15190 [Flammeovirgaceae bacterium]
MKPILEIQSVSKKFNIHHESGSYLSLRDRLAELITFRSPKKSYEDFWALKDVSFDVMPGESIGIIGKNGAGKSTLLKILSKITPPTQGKIISRGRIASLLEVGTGFHPELSGRENIYLNGSILGMKRREIDLKFDEIVDFAGTEKFLDTPLKHYSSGMQLRLAFAVAAFLEPEILIIDEVLAVGDAEFQKKCLGKMEDVSKSGRTILFVSHNMVAVRNLCSRVILLNNGIVKAAGESSEVLIQYQKNEIGESFYQWQIENAPTSAIYFTNISIALEGDQPNYILRILCSLSSDQLHDDVFVAFDFSNSVGMKLMQALPDARPFIKFSTKPHTLEILVELPPLIPDTYYVSAWVGSHFLNTLHQVDDIVGFRIDKSPTPNRSFPHLYDNGILVPISKLL